MILTILGAPGAGKGTLSSSLSKELNLPSISTGALLRDEIASGSQLGKYIDSLISEGNFVPDEMIVEMLSNRLKNEDCKNGYILDGFPRNKTQAEHLEDYGIKLTMALLLDISDDLIVSRLTGRRECSSCRKTYHIKDHPSKVEGICDVCGGTLRVRSDDDAEIIMKRLKIYHKETEPLISFFEDKKLLTRVDASGSIEATKALAFKVLGV